MEALTHKTCNKCLEKKLIECFSADAKSKDGKRNQCKTCRSLSNKDYRVEKVDSIKIKRAEKYKRNIEVERKRSRDYREANIEKTRLRFKIWYYENKSHVIRTSIEWSEKNRDIRKSISSKYNKKIRSTPKGRLSANVSRGVHRGIVSGAKRGRGTFALIGYTASELMKHLEKLFTEGMSWENYGEWHVDHKIPLTVFNYETPDDIDFKRAWSLSNLQPLWAGENLSKGGKITAEFQPSLTM